MTQLIKLFNTSAFRLSMVTVAIFAVITGVLVWYVFPKTTDLMTRQVMETIAAEAEALRDQFAIGGMAQLQGSVASRALPAGAALYFLGGPQGKKLAGNLNRMPPELIAAGKAGTFIYSRSPIGKAGRRAGKSDIVKRLAAGIVIAVPGGSKLIIARDIDEQRQLMQSVKWSIYGSFGLLLLIGLGGGLLVSRQTLRRIDEVTIASKRIMSGDMSGRIPVRGSDDELDRLSINLNSMLARIEQLMSGLREVSDNIAHDLKTPLNRLRNRAEAALRESGDVADYRKALEGTIDEADELIKTFNALLSIARLEAGALAEEMKPVDLAVVLRDVAELYEPLAEEAGFALLVTAAESICIRANRQLIGQMMANLIDNAVKYSADALAGANNSDRGRKQEIKVSLRRAGAGAEIIVADRGPGIDAANRERALKRFVRLEASRSRPGSGLGLSLVSAVVRLHSGVIKLEDNQPGLRVVILFPATCDRLERSAGQECSGPSLLSSVVKSQPSVALGAGISHDGSAVAETRIHARRTP